jgi:LPXTG-motif cell wall-anchored protein
MIALDPPWEVGIRYSHLGRLIIVRKIVVSACVIAAMLCAIPTAASAAADRVAPAAVSTEEGDGYTPNQHQAPTLAGSTAVGECQGDVPWIKYAVELTDPDNQSTGHTARLVLTNGTDTTTIVLGDLVDGKLSGRILWPGASVDQNGSPTGWPGWAFENGQWVETDGNFRWTRGAITAKIEVNPEVAVPLSYPPSTPQCATDPKNPGTPGDPATAGLPATGLSASMLPFAITGGGLALLGLVVLLVWRRRRREA